MPSEIRELVKNYNENYDEDEKNMEVMTTSGS